MKRKNVVILIVVILLLVIALFLVLNQRSGTFRDKDKNFAVQDTANVTKIFLVDKKDRAILIERIKPGEWELNKEHKARNSAVNQILETMKNLAPKYPVPEAAHNTIVSQLAVASVKVEVYQMVHRIDIFGLKLFPHNKCTKTYYVGGATPNNMGTYMLMEGADVPFVVHLLGFRGYVAPRYSTILKNWRDHSIFRINLSDIKSVTMEMPNDLENSFKIVNENRKLSLIKLNTNERLPQYDTLKVLNFLTSFADIRFEALLDDIDPQRKDSILNSTPEHILTIEDINGNSSSIDIFLKPNDNRAFDMEGEIYVHDLDRLYALVNDGRDFVLIQYYVFDKVLRPLSYFEELGF